MPDDAVRELRPDAHTAVVALTHDPKLDDMALLEALRSGAFYVGALGSSRNQAKRKERLAEHFDLTEAELARLHGPVGLRIGAKTPAEIAVSIVAQIVECKNAGRRRPSRPARAATSHESSPSVLVLASGRGERFIASGGTGSKLQALLGGKPVLQRTLDAVRASGLPWHLEDAGHEGMGDSIAAAVRATPMRAAGWCCRATCRWCGRETCGPWPPALAQHAVVVPHYHGQRGHPVGFGAAMPRRAGWR